MSDKKMLLCQAQGGAEFWNGMTQLQPRLMQLAVVVVCAVAGIGILRVVLS